MSKIVCKYLNVCQYVKNIRQTSKINVKCQKYKANFKNIRYMIKNMLKCKKYKLNAKNIRKMSKIYMLNVKKIKNIRRMPQV